MKKTIALGCYHAGYDYKEAVSQLLKSKGYEILNKGTDSPESVDYPDFVHPVAKDIVALSRSRGIRRKFWQEQQAYLSNGPWQSLGGLNRG